MTMARFQSLWRVCVAAALAAGMWATAEAGCHRRGGSGRWAGYGPPSLARLLAGGFYGGGRHQGGYGQPPVGKKRVQAGSPSQPSQPEAAAGEAAEHSPSDRADVPEQQPSADPAVVVAGGEGSPAAGGDAASPAVGSDGVGGADEVVAAGLDVALLDVRLASPPDSVSGVGAVYRISVRNSGTVDIAQPFQIAVLVGKASGAGTEPPVTAEVAGLAVGAAATVDVQLDAVRAPLAGRRLYVVVDSQQQLAEADETNNLAELEMAEIQPVGPGALQLVPRDVAPGSELRIEGSGFGELPGRVVLEVNGVKLLAEVMSWSDTLVCVRLPALVLDGPTTALLAVLPPQGPPHDGLELRLASR